MREAPLAGVLSSGFRGTWTALGVMVTAISVYSMLTRALSVSLSEAIHLIVGSYQAAVHPLAGALFDLCKLELPESAKDLLVIWLAIGSSLARTFFFLFETGAGKGAANWSHALVAPWFDRIVFNNRVLRFMCAAVSIALWPLALLLLLRKPKVCVSQGGRKYALLGAGDAMPGSGGAWYHVRHDLRAVFLSYLLVVAGCVALFSLANAASLHG